MNDHDGGSFDFVPEMGDWPCEYGASMRDFFAGCAMAEAFHGVENARSFDGCAALAYEMANAMIRARSK